MDQHSMDILKILLEKKELHYHEIRSLIESEYKWKMKSNSIRVTVVNKLRELTGEYLQRTDKGHKNVRYAFE